MKLLFLERHAWLSVSAIGALGLLTLMSAGNNDNMKKKTVSCNNPDVPHVCVMKTIFGLETNAESNLVSSFTTSEKVNAAVKKGLDWIGKAQSNDGGWGAGSHYQQDVRDPHAVPSDPATTSLVAMALLRTDNTLEKGNYSAQLKRSTEFLLKAVEDCPANQPYLTTLQNTQPQTKLGRNIDVILTAQFLTNILRYDIKDEALKQRINRALDKCVARIQKGQDTDGSWKDGGWAPVLQSALANNALESAGEVGAKVDSVVMQRSQQYQASNFDLKTNSALTGSAAGVTLYGLSSTNRASAKEARRAKEILKKARLEGKIKNEDVTELNLAAAGVSTTEAKKLVTGYAINTASGEQAVRDDVMAGFGSNGGEEFMSFLMTGEGMLIKGGDEWKKWYEMMSGKLVNIQGNDGAWQGHHCITSPVFCTATCLLILSIHNDMQFSMQQHPK